MIYYKTNTIIAALIYHPVGVYLPIEEEYFVFLDRNIMRSGNLCQYLDCSPVFKFQYNIQIIFFKTYKDSKIMLFLPMYKTSIYLINCMT